MKCCEKKPIWKKVDYGLEQNQNCKHLNVRIRAGQFWKDIGWKESDFK